MLVRLIGKHIFNKKFIQIKVTTNNPTIVQNKQNDLEMLRRQKEIMIGVLVIFSCFLNHINWQIKLERCRYISKQSHPVVLKISLLYGSLRDQNYTNSNSSSLPI